MPLKYRSVNILDQDAFIKALEGGVARRRHIHEESSISHNPKLVYISDTALQKPEKIMPIQSVSEIQNVTDAAESALVHNISQMTNSDKAQSTASKRRSTIKAKQATKKVKDILSR